MMTEKVQPNLREHEIPQSKSETTAASEFAYEWLRTPGFGDMV